MKNYRPDYEALGAFGILLGMIGFIFIGLGIWKGFFIPLGLIFIFISLGIILTVIFMKDRF